jgi:ribosomal protein L40E
MELPEVESRLKFMSPERHRQAILDSSDPIHKACEFSVLSDNRRHDIFRTNEWIHSSEFGNPWPDFLIAFASNGCGDYFAYDTRQSPTSIIYIDPDNTVEENLQASDKLCFETFEIWYESTIEPYICRRCQSREARFEASDNRRFLLRVCPKCGFQERTVAIER